MVSAETLTNPVSFAKDLIQNYFIADWRYDDARIDDHLVTTIVDQIATHDMKGMSIPDAFEYWDWKEEETHFIKQVQTYEYLSYDWWAPYFDRAYLDHLSALPPRFRHNRRIHSKIAKRVCKDQAGAVPTFPDDTEKPGVSGKVKDRLKDFRVVKRIGQRVIDYKSNDVATEYNSDPRYAIIGRSSYENWTTKPVQIGDFELMPNNLAYDGMRALDICQSETSVSKRPT
jgi:hypothetical protein